MNILEKIVNHKRREVDQRKELYPVPLLEQSIYFPTPVVSLCDYLQRPDKSGIIAEFKRQSPSKGPINLYASVEEVSISYMQAGASALSVLTDMEFFKGSNKDLTEARIYNYCPILRKDFVVDEYQIIEAKSIGADAILLIAECLSAEEVKAFSELAHSLGLEVLMEVHSQEQLEKVGPAIDLVGVNNRNLEDFSVSIETSLQLASAIPTEKIRISESGISRPEAIHELRQAGYQGFLIGEHFMSAPHPGEACRQFIRAVRELSADSSPVAS
jgi:indole-3-glycerol phosphate synthase